MHESPQEPTPPDEKHGKPSIRLKPNAHGTAGPRQPEQIKPLSLQALFDSPEHQRLTCLHQFLAGEGRYPESLRDTELIPVTDETIANSLLPPSDGSRGMTCFTLQMEQYQQSLAAAPKGPGEE